MKHFFLLLLTIILASINIYSQKNIQYYKGKNIVIDFPLTWEMKTNYMNTDVIALSQVKNKFDFFRENVNLVMSVKSNYTLTEYYDQNVQLMKEKLTAFKIDSKGDEQIDSVNSKWVLFSHLSGNLGVKVLSYTFIYKNYVYYITCSSLYKDYNSYVTHFEKIVQSIKLE
jgi:hypothetical protein